MSKKHALPLLFITLLIDMIGIGMIIPIIPIIFTDPTSSSFVLHGYSRDMQFLIAGLVTALYGVMTFIAAPIELSDIYGRKKLLLLGVGILAASQLMFGLGIIAGSLSVLLISRAVAGLAGANISIAQAAIADISKPEHRAKNFGLIGAAFGLGFILGPVLGGLIAHATGTASSPFFVAGILGVLNLLSVTFFLPETRIIGERKQHTISFTRAITNIKVAFADKSASSIYIASFLYMIGFAFFTSTTGIYLVQRYGLSAASLGTYFGVIGIWIVITQGFILRVITKLYNERQILFVSLVCVGVAIVAVPFMPNIIYQYILVPFIAIPQGLSMANMSALISKSVSPEKQGTALGINGSLSALAQGTVPILMGGLIALFGVAIPYVVAGIAIMLAWRNLFWKSVK
jgi:DHA1 family tetracycline resistance protein-like MFS transporter